MMCGVGALLISLSCLLHHISFIHTQVVPNSYLSNKRSVSLNGSHVGGGCSIMIVGNDEFCMAPASSVLFDGVIPTINNSTTWARQLLTFSPPSGNTLSITFTFMPPTSVNGARIPFTGVSRVEIVMFNCPSRYHGRTIGIVVKDNNERIVESISFTDYTSCDHLIRIYTSVNFYISSNEIKLVFTGEKGHSVYSIYLAEVTFYSILDNHTTVGPTTSSATPRRNYTATTSTKNTNDEPANTTSTARTTDTACLVPSSLIAVLTVISFVVGNFCGILGICLVLGVYKLHKNRTNLDKKDSFSVEMQTVPTGGVPDAFVYEDIDDIKKGAAPEDVQLQQNTAYGQISR